MRVSVETTSGLERKLTVGVPAFNRNQFYENSTQ